MDKFAEYVVNVWSVAGVVFFGYGWLNYPVLVVFFCHRLAQLRDKHFDLRPTTPTHTMLHYYCAALYGIALPAFYFLTVRLRNELAAWKLGSNTNSRWTIALGVMCMVWLATHVIRAARNGDRIRFGGLIDRIFAGTAFALCLWFHFWTVKSYPLSLAGRWPFGSVMIAEYLMAIVYPQSHFLGATLVYGLAFSEASRFPAPIITARQRAMRWATSTAVFTLIFAPWWLGLPRVSHRQALELIRQNRAHITEAARSAKLDPNLLAGIIYVSQTRERSRWTGDFMDRFGLAINRKRSIYNEFGDAKNFDGRIGLCQIRPSQCESLANREGHERDLLTLTGNLEIATMIIVDFRHQWRRAEFPIDHRPEILATLFNIGRDHSHPKADPKPNDFGLRVKKFMESPDCRRALEGK
ncbi:hypothetical protein LLG95_06200 [bacterium]|nr:hypothetical protein [bacterium]